MEVEGRRRAFELMIQERGIYRKLGVERSTVSGWKKYLKEGKSISEDKMKEMLMNYNAIMIRSEVWYIDLDSDYLFTDNMIDFYDELQKLVVGDQIEVDYSTNMSEIMVNRYLNVHCIKLKTIILRDDSRLPIVTYTFEKKLPYKSF